MDALLLFADVPCTLLADLAPPPNRLPTDIWWKLLAGVIGLAVVGAILVALMWVSFRNARRTVREARAEHAALSEQLLADARAHGARTKESQARNGTDGEA